MFRVWRGEVEWGPGIDVVDVQCVDRSECVDVDVVDVDVVDVQCVKR